MKTNASSNTIVAPTAEQSGHNGQATAKGCNQIC
jgi:hypothetical protein